MVLLATWCSLCARNLLTDLRSQNHRIIGWKRPLRSLSPTVSPTPPCLLNQIPKCPIYTVFKHLQRWWLNHFPGQPVPMPDTKDYVISIVWRSSASYIGMWKGQRKVTRPWLAPQARCTSYCANNKKVQSLPKRSSLPFWGPAQSEGGVCTPSDSFR